MDREYYYKMYENEDEHWWFVARRLILKKILDKYCVNNKSGRILEIGCGTGGNLRMLNAYGEISAMEMDSEARVLADSRNICDVKEGSLPSDVPFKDDFDVICMFDVLEHIDDDLSALQAVREKMRPNGKLLITVPAYRFMWSNHDVITHHKRRYIKKELLDVVEKSGLTVRYSSYFNTFLFPVIAAVRFANNVLRKESGSDVNKPSELMNKVLMAIFSSERALLPTISIPFGVSIVLVAENRQD